MALKSIIATQQNKFLSGNPESWRKGDAFIKNK